MKKVIISMLLLTWIASPASACGKKGKNHSTAKHTSTAVRERDNMPAVIDHSYDEAYSARWTQDARSPEPGTRLTMRRRTNNVDANIWAVQGSRNTYSLSDINVYGLRSYRGVSMNSPYEGEDSPSNDGHVKNEYRNMRANNTSEQLPSNKGK